MVERLDGSPEEEYECREGDECTRCPKLLCIDGVEAVVTFCGRPESHYDSSRPDGEQENNRGDGSTRPQGNRPEVDLVSDGSQSGAEEDTGADGNTGRGSGRPQRQFGRGGGRGGRRGGRF